MKRRTDGGRWTRLLWFVLVALLLAGFLAACAPRSRSVSATPPVTVAAATLPARPPSADTARMLALVNEARARSQRCGNAVLAAAPPLGWDDTLALAAERHARAMAVQGFVGHVSPSGSTVGDRIAAAGYRARAWGENIAAGYVDPAETVAGFLASPSHCEVLMAHSFEVLGAALVEVDGSVYGSYWTLVFAAPR